MHCICYKEVSQNYGLETFLVFNVSLSSMFKLFLFLPKSLKFGEGIQIHKFHKCICIM